MENDMLKKISLLIIVFILACATSDAHRLMLGYNVLEVQVNALYDDGTPAQGVDIDVTSNGKSIAQGITDECGTYSFRPQGNAGELEFTGKSAGHRAVLPLDLAEKKQQDEITLPQRAAAGLGYLMGIAGLAMIYLSKKGSRKT
jgi:nickel transport protein